MGNGWKDLIKHIPDKGHITYGELAETATSNGYSHNDFLLAMHFLKFYRLIESDCEICSVTVPQSDIYLTD